VIKYLLRTTEHTPPAPAGNNKLNNKINNNNKGDKNVTTNKNNIKDEKPNKTQKHIRIPYRYPYIPHGGANIQNKQTCSWLRSGH
jgi:hypothetical protein